MAKSFDITKKPKYRPAPPSPPSAPTAPSRRKKNKGEITFVIFLTIVIASALAYIKFSDQKSTSAKPAKQIGKTETKTSDTTQKNNNTKSTSTATSPQTTEKDETKPTAGSIDKKDQPLKIQILNGTGNETITSQAKQLLETNSIKVESAAKAQFDYGQTYIYYRPEAIDDAKKISELLSDYKPTLSESQISGLFDILIIIGKDNLPAQ